MDLLRSDMNQMRELMATAAADHAALRAQLEEARSANIQARHTERLENKDPTPGVGTVKLVVKKLKKGKLIRRTCSRPAKVPAQNDP